MDLEGEDVAMTQLQARTQRWWHHVISYGFAHRSPRDDELCNLFLGWICIPPEACLASHPPHRLHPTTPGITLQTLEGVQVLLEVSHAEHLQWRLRSSLSLGTVSLLLHLLKKNGPAIVTERQTSAERQRLHHPRRAMNAKSRKG